MKLNKKVKVIQYLHGTNWLPAAVSAWSLRKNAGFPQSATYTLYTTTPENFDVPELRRAFDSVLPPPPAAEVEKLCALDWENVENPVAEKQKALYPPDFRKYCLTKFLLWLREPCASRELVLHVDYDTLCVGSLLEAVPTGGKAWSAFRYQNTRAQGILVNTTNNGFLYKNSRFGTLGLDKLIETPLWDLDIYRDSLKLCPWGDEVCTAWFGREYGWDTLQELDSRFNRNARAHVLERRTLEDADVRLVHWNGTNKPWNPAPPLVKLAARWEAIRDEFLQDTCQS
ncbi:MAG: hypothetical protein Q4D38_12505 [Planctomycetia bacterium]|nr:hypothetical protein [Planctomycetia bacterium]